jgi:hypothetical protein
VAKTKNTTKAERPKAADRPIDQDAGVYQQSPTDRSSTADTENFQSGSLQAPLRRLADSYRANVVEQFARIATEVERDAAIPTGERVAIFYELIENLFAAVDRLSQSAPAKAPELWRSRRDKSEKIFDFIRRVYGRYLGKLRRADLRKLDFSLYNSLYYKKHRAEADLDLPTVREANDKLLAELNGNVSITDIRDKMPAVLRDRLRLYRTVATRRRAKKRTEQE